MLSSTNMKTTRARIGPRSAGLPMTVEEFDAWPSSRWVKGYRYELIHGVLIVSPPPDNAEIDPNEELGYLLRFHQRTHPQGSVIDVTLSEQTIETPANRRRADRAVWIGLGRMPNLATDFPAILIEFVSPSREAFLRDTEVKRDEYLAAGVREYWVFDRFRRTLTVFRNQLDGMMEVVTVEPSQSYQTALLPGFSLPLDPILAKADNWPRAVVRRRPAEHAPSPRPDDGGFS